MLDAWLLHAALPLALPWAAGLGLALHGRRWGLAAVFGAFLTGLIVSLVPGLGHIGNLLQTEHWLALAAVMLLARPPSGGAPRLASLAPLPLAGQGLGALILVVTIAGKGLLERGARARGWLAAAIGLLALATLLDAELLWLWDRTVALTGLGSDPASLAVRLLVAAVRVAGWGAALGWLYSSPSPPQCSSNRRSSASK